MLKRWFGLLTLANTMVLVGQIWPEGAPPFAYHVNVATLGSDVLTFVYLFLRSGDGKKSKSP